MEPQHQIDLLNRLLHYVETRTTYLADAPWRNDVSVYTAPDHLAREQQILFRQHPILMGFASEWAMPGAFRTDDLAGVPILVVRGRDNQLRAFLNVCRHRGAQVAQGCGEARVFSCPYHAWTYDLAGQVTGIPHEHCFPEVRSERPSLTALPLCEKHGLVWVIPTPAADGATGFDIDPWLGGLGPELGSYGFESWVFYDKRVIPETMNWKIIVDTFHEGYHIGFLHRESLRSILHGNVADFEPFGRNHRLTFPRKKLERLKDRAARELGPDVEHDTDLLAVPQHGLDGAGRSRRAVAHLPAATGASIAPSWSSRLYVPRAPVTQEERTHWDKNMQLVLDIVTGEDFPAGRSIQLGLTSGAQSHTVFGRNEPAMIHYHQAMQAALGSPLAHDMRVAAE